MCQVTWTLLPHAHLFFFLAFCTLLLQLGLCILCMLCLWNCPVCISRQELQKVSFLTNLLGAEFKNPCGLLAFFFWALIGEIQYVVFCVFLWLVHFAFVLFVWYICAVFSLFVTKPSDWLWTMFLKGFVVCQVGQNLNLINRHVCCVVFLSVQGNSMACQGQYVTAIECFTKAIQLDGSDYRLVQFIVELFLFIVMSLMILLLSQYVCWWVCKTANRHCEA